MKKFRIIIMLFVVVFLVTGCGNKQKEEAKEACKQEVKKIVEENPNADIKECYATYEKESGSVLIAFCMDDTNLYKKYNNVMKKDSTYGEAEYSNYEMETRLIEDGTSDAYYFEFTIDELK